MEIEKSSSACSAFCLLLSTIGSTRIFLSLFYSHPDRWIALTGKYDLYNKVELHGIFGKYLLLLSQWCNIWMRYEKGGVGGVLRFGPPPPPIHHQASPNIYVPIRICRHYYLHVYIFYMKYWRLCVPRIFVFVIYVQNKLT